MITPPAFTRYWFGISGKRSSGKDTVAEMMTTYLHKVTPGRPVFHISFGKLIMDEYCKNAFITPEQYLANKEHHRKELIKIGERPEYWMQQAFAEVSKLPHIDSYVIISGVRYLIQANILHQIGALLFRVTRNNIPRHLELDTHRSECELDTYGRWNGIIYNNGTIEGLRYRVNRLLDTWLEGRVYTNIKDAA